MENGDVFPSWDSNLSSLVFMGVIHEMMFEKRICNTPLVLICTVLYYKLHGTFARLSLTQVLASLQLVHQQQFSICYHLPSSGGVFSTISVCGGKHL